MISLIILKRGSLSLIKNFWEKKITFFGVFITMKKILRLTESDLVRLVKRVINEQQEMTFQQYMDQLLVNPVEFLNKLNSDEQFKNLYIKSYGPQQPGNPNWGVLEKTKVKHLVSNGLTITGQIKDDKTNEVLKNYEISTLDELMKLDQFVSDLEAKGRSIFDVGYVDELSDVKNGKEVAQCLNIARGNNWFK